MESCSPYQKYFKYDFDQQKSGTIRTLVITPIDMIRARPQGTDAQSIKKLEIKIQNYLLSNGYNIEPNTALVKNWELESGKLNGFFDPSTGKIDASKISMCLVNAIGKTKTEQNFNSSLFGCRLTATATGTHHKGYGK